MTGPSSEDPREPPVPKSQSVPAAVGTAGAVTGAVAAAAIGLGFAVVPAAVVALGVAAAISGIVAREIRRHADPEGQRNIGD